MIAGPSRYFACRPGRRRRCSSSAGRLAGAGLRRRAGQRVVVGLGLSGAAPGRRRSAGAAERTCPAGGGRRRGGRWPARPAAAGSRAAAGSAALRRRTAPGSPPGRAVGGRGAGRRGRRWRCRSGSARPERLAITGRNRSCAVWPSSLGLVAVLAGHRDDDPVGALGDHLGLGDAEAVDPALDDLPGLVERLRGWAGLPSVGAGLQRDRGAALQVQARAWGCAESPVKKTSA